MNCSLSSGPTGFCGSLGLLGLRLMMGAAFILHGWPKIQNATGWMGPDSTVPGTFQALAAGCEFVGGILLVGGLLTRLAALGIGGVMVGALALVHIPQGHPFVSSGGPSCEPATFYLAAALLFLCTGAGRFSLDAVLFCRRNVHAAQLPS